MAPPNSSSDQQAYIDALLDQQAYLPDDFRIWILEWPAKAAIACCWPGLPYKYWRGPELDDGAIQGCNFLGRIPPVLHTVPVQINRIGPTEDWVEVNAIEDAEEAEKKWVSFVED
ncbi:hypothetical protein B0H13DRAFT_1918618 [Mycena leptocephala]|nr:hypothetical protein B0H13DRAFT_1918618 [Mycena leptocephala]